MVAGTPTNFASLKTLANTLISAITGGYTTISPVANHLLAGLMVIVIVLSAVLTWIWGEGDRVIIDLIRKTLFFGFIFFIMQHWLAFTGDIATGFTKLGLQVGGLHISPTQFLSNPVNTLLVGWHITQALNTAVLSLQHPWWATLGNFPSIVVYCAALIFVMVAFSVLAFQLFISYIEFLLVTLIGLLFVPFCIFPPTKFLSDRTFGFVFAGSAKLFAISLIVAVSSNFLQTIVVSSTPDVGNAFAVTIAAAFCAALAISIPSLAGALISGAPQTSGSGVAMATAGVVAATAGAAYVGSRAMGRVGGSALGASVRGIGNAASALTGAATGGAAGAAAGAAAGGAAGGVAGAGAGAAGAGAGVAGTTANVARGAGAGSPAGGAMPSGAGASRAGWMKKTGGMANLSGADRKAAMKAYSAWKDGPGAGLPHGPDSYVDYVQQQTAAEMNGSNPSSLD